jgi:hypothetical protein
VLVGRRQPACKRTRRPECGQVASARAVRLWDTVVLVRWE